MYLDGIFIIILKITVSITTNILLLHLVILRIVKF